ASPSSASRRIFDNRSAGFGEDGPGRIAASLRPRAMRPDLTFEGLSEESPSLGLTWSRDSAIIRAWPLVWLATHISSWPTQSVLEQRLQVRPVGRGPLVPSL